MARDEAREIYRSVEGGGVQLAAGADRWYLFGGHVHLAPHHARGGRLVRYEAEPLPFVDNLNREALVIVDMQNDFCARGGWVDATPSAARPACAPP